MHDKIVARLCAPSYAPSCLDFLAHVRVKRVPDTNWFLGTHNMLKRLEDLTDRTECDRREDIGIDKFDNWCDASFIKHKADLNKGTIPCFSDTELCEDIVLQYVFLQE